MNNDSTISPSEPHFLRREDIAAIEGALHKVGAFGEVHLVVENGHLHYLRTLRSEPLDSETPKCLGTRKPEPGRRTDLPESTLRAGMSRRGGSR